MRALLIGLLALSSLSAFSGTNDECKAVALKVAKAVDKVYTPKLAKGTKITSTLLSSSPDSTKWLVNYMVPNAGGQTAYEIELGSDGCNLINLASFAE